MEPVSGYKTWKFDKIKNNLKIYLENPLNTVLMQNKLKSGLFITLLKLIFTRLVQTGRCAYNTFTEEILTEIEK